MKFYLKKTYESVIDALKELNELESYYIEKYNSFKNGYNMTLGGEGVRGIVFDENTKSKIRETLKKFYNNKPNPFKGKRHSLETRKKLSEIAKKRKYSPNKGKKLSLEHRKKISERNKLNVGEKNPFFGKKHTDKTKELIGKANGKPVLQIDINNGNILRVFKSAKEAGLFFGKPKGNSEIIKVCKNYISPKGKHYLTALGYKWAYATTEDSTTNERVSSDTTE